MSGQFFSCLCFDTCRSKYKTLRHSICLSPQEAADEVIDIFSQSEHLMLVSVCASPCMINVSPARTLQILQNLEDSVGVSVSLTITMAAMMLRLGDVQQYTQLMERHAEVRI